MVGRPRGLAKLIVIGIAAVVLLLCIILFAIHPYARLESIAGEALTRHAPPGTTVKDIKLSFPSRIVLTNFVIPVQIKNRRQEIAVDKISGNLSLLAFFQGKVKAQMNSDLFGGTLWLGVRVDAYQAASSSGNSSVVAFEARARDLDILQLCGFFQAPVMASGICSSDVDAEFDERNPESVSGRALVLGERIDVPAWDLEDVILPTTYNGTLNAKLSAGNGKVVIEAFNFEGSAYDVSGTGTIRLGDPLDMSILDCSFTALFKESPTITNEDLVAGGADQVMEAFVSAGARLAFTVTGPAKKPDIRVDPVSSLNSIMQHTNR